MEKNKTHREKKNCFVMKNVICTWSEKLEIISFCTLNFRDHGSVIRVIPTNYVLVNL